MANLENRKMRDNDELLRDVLVSCLIDSHCFTYWRHVEIFLRLLDMKYLENLMEILNEVDYLSQDAFIGEISSYVSKIYYKSCVFYNSGVDIKEQIDVLEGRRDNLKSFLVLKIKRLCNEQAN